MIQESGRRSLHRLIVQFRVKEPVSKEMIEQRCQSVLEIIPKGALVRGPGRTGRAVFSVDPDAVLHQVAEEVGRREDVEYAEPDVTDSEAR